MKVLKSGIEIDPSDLSKVKGGACACGCVVGVNSEFIHITGINTKMCSCYCYEEEYGTGNMGRSAQIQIFPPEP